MLGEPSDICTDFGASPQDVRHLFACTIHPTDLSSEDLWRIRWDQFVRLAISTTETLTDLTTDLVVANNNNNSQEEVTQCHQQYIYIYTYIYIIIKGQDIACLTWICLNRLRTGYTCRKKGERGPLLCIYHI